MAFWDWMFGRKKTVTKGPEFYRAPEYPEAERARETLGTRLGEWGEEPSYGAISPDWADIWERAQKKVGTWLYGRPGMPGALATATGGAAGRRVTGPARAEMRRRATMTSGEMIADLAREQAIREAEFAERGRQNWMTQLMRLAGMRPQTYMQPGMTYTEGGMPWGQAIGDIAGIYAGGLQDWMKRTELEKIRGEEQTWWEKMMKEYGMGMPGMTPATITP